MNGFGKSSTNLREQGAHHFDNNLKETKKSKFEAIFKIEVQSNFQN